MIDLTAGIDTEEAIRQLRKLQQEAKRVTSNVVTDSEMMDISMRRLGNTIAKLGIGFSLGNLVRQIAQTRGEFQQLEVAFTTLLQSKEKADALMAQMVELAAKTPFDLQGVASGARQLLAYGFAAEDVTDVLTRLGNVAAGLGLNLQDLTWLYGTTAVQGRLYTRDVMQFQSRGIDLAGELATMLGKTRAEINQMVTEGKIGFPEVQKAIENMTNEGGKFYNLMQEQSKTITGLISNLGDAIDTMFNDIGKSQEGVIAGVLKGTISLVENYEKVLNILLPLVAAYGTYKAVLIMTAALEKAKKSALIASAKAFAEQTKMLRRTTQAQILFNKAVSAMPLQWALSLLALIGTAIWEYASGSEEAAENTLGLARANKKAAEEVDEEIAKIKSLQDVLNNSNNAISERKKALNDLKSVVPNYHADLTSEGQLINNNTEALKNYIKEFEKSVKLQAAKDELQEAYKQQRQQQKERAKAQRALELAQSRVPTSIGQMGYGEAGVISTRASFSDVEKAEDRLSEIDRELTKTAKTISELNDEITRSSILTRDNTTGAITSASENLRVAQQAYDEAVKTWKDAVEQGKDVSVVKQKQGDVETAKKALDEAKKLAGVDDKTIKEITKSQQKLSDSLVQSELDLQSRRIAIMREGKNKRLAEIDLEYQQTAAKINQNRKESVKNGATEDELSVFDGQMTVAEQKRIHDRAQVEKEYAEQTAETYRQLADVFLSEEERKTRAIEERYRKMRQEQLDKFLGGNLGSGFVGAGKFLNITALINKAEQQETIAELLKKYQSYADKRTELERQFDKEEKTLLANRTADNADAIDRSLDELARRRAKELAELDSSVQASSSLWSRLFDTYSNYTNNQLQEIIAHAQQVLDYVNNTEFEDISPRFGMSAEQLQNLKTNASDLSAVYDALGEKLEQLNKRNPFGAMIRSSQLLRKNTTEVEKAERELAKAQASGDKQAIEDAEKRLEGLQRQQALLKGDLKTSALAAASYLGEVGDSLQQIGEAAGDAGLASFGKALSDVSAIAEKFISGDTIGGVISIITTGLSAIFSSQAKYRAALQQMREDQIAFAHEYKLLLSDIRLEAEQASNAFSDDVFAKAIAALKEMRGNYESFLELVNKDEGIQASRQGLFGRFNQTKQEIKGITTDLQNIWIQTRHKTWFRSAKGEYLKDLYPELFEGPEELGGFNVEAARALLETNNQLNDEAKRQLQEVIDLYDQWQEAEDQFKEYLNSTFGEIGDSLGDSIVDAFKNGTDAMETWGQSFNNVLENLGKQMMQTLFFQKYFDRLENDLTRIYDNYGSDPNELALQVNNLLGNFFEQMSTVSESAADWYERFAAIAQKHGFDLSGNESTAQQQASSNGFQTMSQDTGNELNGRFTAIQENTTIIKNSLEFMRNLSTENLNRVTDIRDIAIQLNGNVADIRDVSVSVVRKILPEMAANIASMDKTLKTKL